MAWIKTFMTPIKLCVENPDFPISGIFKDVPWELSGGTKQVCIVTSTLILSNNTDTVVEIGAWQGFSSLILGRTLACNSLKGMLVTVDINKQALTRSRNFTKSIPIEHVLIEVDSLNLDLNPYLKGRKVGLAFIDGNHDYKWALNDIKKCSDILIPYGFIVVHDYSKGSHPGVYQAVNEFVEETKYPLIYLNENRESTDYRAAIIQKRGEL